MAAARCNYLVTYENSPQVYSSSTLQTILKGAPPKNCTDEGRSILFITYFPDDKEMRVYKVTDEEITAELQKLEDKENATKANQLTDEETS
jgi:hypothetical protein